MTFHTYTKFFPREKKSRHMLIPHYRACHLYTINSVPKIEWLLRRESRYVTGGPCLLPWPAVLLSCCSGFTAQASEQKSGKQRKDHEFCVVLQTGVAGRQLAVPAKGNKYIVRETQKKWHKHGTTRQRLTQRWGWRLTWGEGDF